MIASDLPQPVPQCFQESSIPGGLDDVRRRGFHGVWLMGVWTTGAEAKRIALRDPDLRAAYDRLLPGWTEEIDATTDRDALPPNAQAYLRRIEEIVGVPVEIVSVGPERSQTLLAV